MLLLGAPGTCHEKLRPSAHPHPHQIVLLRVFRRARERLGIGAGDRERSLGREGREEGEGAPRASSRRSGRGGTGPAWAASHMGEQQFGEKEEMTEVARDLADVPGNRKIGEAIIQARAFHKLAELGVEAYFGGDRTTWTAVTPVLAFAVELYLKALNAVRSGGQWPRGHELKALFERLPADDRAELERRYEAVRTAAPGSVLGKILPGRDLSLNGVLEESSNAFAELRYAYETAENPPPKQLPDAFGLWWLIGVLRPYVEKAEAPK